MLQNYLVLKPTGEGNIRGRSCVVAVFGTTKNMRVVGNIPYLVHGMCVKFDLTSDNHVKDYQLDMTPNNVAALERAGINPEEYEIVLTRHMKLKSEGIGWNVAKLGLDKIYEILPFGQADRIHKEMVNDMKEETRMNAIQEEIIQNARMRKQIAYNMNEYLSYFNGVERKGAYAHLAMVTKRMCVERENFQYTGGIIWDKKMQIKEQYILNNILTRIDNEYELLTEAQIELFVKSRSFKQRGLSDEQAAVLKCLLTSKPCIIKGGAGTGKTVLAIYFIKCLMDILHRNTNFDDLDEVLPEDSPILQSAQLVKIIKEHKDLNIAFVVPTPSFRETVKKIFKATRGLKPNMVIGPNDIAKKDYDIVIVDEAHRLQRRQDLVNYGAYDAVCDKLNLDHSATQLDWIMAKKRPVTVIFYDSKQRVKTTDMLDESFNSFVDGAEVITLGTQLRIQGGNEYIEFINKLLNNEKASYVSDKYDLVVFDDYGEMEQAIKDQNKKNEGLCRVVAGISYPYSTHMRDKVAKKELDVDVDGDGKYLRMWNLGFNDPTFITDEAHKDEIGCVYTCQGYDLNYVGVILGPDIFYNTETKQIDIHIDKCTDKKTKVKGDIEATKKNILHQYLVLLTRGIYGTYIYAVDKNLRDYLNECIKTKKEDLN